MGHCDQTMSLLWKKAETHKETDLHELATWQQLVPGQRFIRHNQLPAVFHHST